MSTMSCNIRFKQGLGKGQGTLQDIMCIMNIIYMNYLVGILGLG